VKVYLGGKKIRVEPAMAIGKGGEADVYDIGNGLALKIFKTPKHPDLAGFPSEQQAAKDRIAMHQHKLRAFPKGLPERVVAPESLATTRGANGTVVGYAMRLIAGADLLHRFAEPRIRRRGVDGNRVTAVLRDLRRSVKSVHTAGVVIGDFNDLNVLVVSERAYLIDADSYQFGGYPCTVYTERFVDPLLCDPQVGRPILVAPHTADSDWYAFAIIAMRSLLCVGPYGGVFRPQNKRERIAHAERPMRRITLFRPDVIYPKPAYHFSVLPDDLLQHLERVFSDDHRGDFPRPLLDGLRWTRCRDCGAEHARLLCPKCSGGRGKNIRTSLRVRGSVTAETVFSTDGEVIDSQLVGDELRWIYWQGGALYRGDGARLAEIYLAPELRIRCCGDGALLSDRGCVRVVGPKPDQVMVADSNGLYTAADAWGPRKYWVQGGRLLRDGRWGPELVGEVLTGQTRFWVGADLGFGFYRAGSLNVAFVFDSERPGIDDSVRLPPPRGSLVDAHCVLGRDRAWFFVTEEAAGKLSSRCVLVGSDGSTLAAAESNSDEDFWLHAGRSACAVGDFLFVATDQGVLRVERDGSSLVETRRFTDTEPFVDASCRLHAGARGLYVVARDRILRLELNNKGVSK